MSIPRNVPCSHTCPGGAPCVLRGDVAHTMHACSTPGCLCHQRACLDPAHAEPPAAQTRHQPQTPHGYAKTQIQRGR